jgi:hypothetical protein
MSEVVIELIGNFLGSDLRDCIAIQIKCNGVAISGS